MDNTAFAFSIFVLMSSYAASVLYVFRIDTGFLARLGALVGIEIDQECVDETVKLAKSVAGPWVRTARDMVNKWVWPHLEQLINERLLNENPH